jgi:hypothetical protein
VPPDDAKAGGDEQPTDQELTVKTFWLGWDVAELRGRCRPDFVHVNPPPSSPRIAHALPLANERSEREQELQLVQEMEELAAQLSLSAPGHEAAPPLMTIWELRRGSWNAEESQAEVWNRISESFYRWDASIQDALLMKPARAAAYQLGRGLAETYWALDPSIGDSNDWRSWGFLLGQRRCQRMKQLVARISAFTDPMTPLVVWTSLDTWQEVAASKPWRDQQDARSRLYQQGVLWRDLIRGEQRPSDLVHTRGEVARIAVLPSVLKNFRWEIIIAGVAAAGLAVAGTAVAQGSSSWGSTIAVFLSGIGLTAAGLFARAKATATSLVEQLNQEVAKAQIARAGTCVPTRPASAR